jgi:hypothetical protein
MADLDFFNPQLFTDIISDKVHHIKRSPFNRLVDKDDFPLFKIKIHGCDTCLKDGKIIPEKKKKNDCHSYNDTIITEYPEAMFGKVGNECLDSDDCNDKGNDIPGYQHHHIMVIQYFRRFPPGIPEALGECASQSRHGKEKRKFGCKFPGQFLLHPANNGCGTAAETREYNGQKLKTTNDERFFIGYLFFLLKV